MEEQGGPLPIVAYEHTMAMVPTIARAGPTRPWMDATPRRFAYRCLPLVIANQAGWALEALFEFNAVWNGEEGPDAVAIWGPPPPDLGGHSPSDYVSSHFGSGVLTFSVPYLFRTPPGYNLWVKGPTNRPKDGIAPLEGLVETDWAHATFTMNWVFTRPHSKVTFAKGEPICQVLPYPRGLIERFEPVVLPIAAEPALASAFEGWRTDRADFNRDALVEGTPAHQAGWQKHYHQGLRDDGGKARGHQTHIAIKEFHRPGDVVL